jgi:hypothetical protein
MCFFLRILSVIAQLVVQPVSIHDMTMAAQRFTVS